MKKQRIYLDTSVIGGCFDPEFAPWSRGLMRDFREGTFLPVVSELVSAEIEAAPDAVLNTYRDLLELDAELLSLSEASDVLAARYIEHGVVPPRFEADGLHIAIATVARGGSPSELELSPHRPLRQDSDVQRCQQRGGVQGDRDLLPTGGDTA